MSTAAHTPLPWTVVKATEYHGPYITTAFGTTVCDLYAMTDPHSAYAICRGETTARPISHTDADLNAPLIVRAVNAHDELLAALKDVLRTTERWGLTSARRAAYTAAVAAIARAEGRS